MNEKQVLIGGEIVMASSNNSTNSGMGVSSVLQIVFIVLKLVGTINWSWWWVLSPTWISIALVLIIWAIVGITIFFSDY